MEKQAYETTAEFVCVCVCVYTWPDKLYSPSDGRRKKELFRTELN